MNILAKVRISKREGSYHYYSKVSEDIILEGGPYDYYEDAYFHVRNKLWEDHSISDKEIEVEAEGVTEVGGFKIAKLSDGYYFNAKVKESGTNYQIGPFKSADKAEGNALTLLKVRHGLEGSVIKIF